MEPHDEAAGDDGAVHLHTALALSGGGHRAALFGLGALLALAQTQASKHVTSISSVSGASLANGAIASRLDYAETAYETFKSHVAAIARCIASPPLARSPLAQKLAIAGVLVVAAAVLALPWWLTPADLGVESDWLDRHVDLTRVLIVAVGTLVTGVLLRVLVTGGGPLFAWWGTWVYLAALVALVEAVFAGIPRLGDVPDALLYAVGGLLILLGFAWRGRLTAWAFGSKLFPGGGRTKLRAVERSLDHVICATDLHAGEHVYFAPRFVYAYRFGLGEPRELPLRTPVQASAAFPGAFPVRWIRRRFGFEQVGQSEHRTPPFLGLVDGGVYDNMGDEWAQGLSNRPGNKYRKAEAVIVVNASASMPYGSVWPLSLPLVGGALAFWREKSVLYDSGTAQRRRAMVREFDLASLGGDGYRGTLVHISQSPYKGAERFKDAQGPWADRATRAQEALDWLAAHSSFGEDTWIAVAEANPTVPTTLVGFDPETASRLLYHGYVLTLINGHVFLGHGLPEQPLSYDDVGALVAG